MILFSEPVVKQVTISFSGLGVKSIISDIFGMIFYPYQLLCSQDMCVVFSDY